MNEQIQEAIDQAEYTQADIDNNCIGVRLIVDEGKFYMHTKPELLSLLKLVAEDAWDKGEWMEWQRKEEG